MRVSIRKEAVIIKNWALVESNKIELYTPPIKHPRQDRALRGFIVNHPVYRRDIQNGLTSDIVKSDGRYVTTRSGTLYWLGKINPKYRKFLNQAGYYYDTKNPIKAN
jgi:hypothetical protein